MRAMFGDRSAVDDLARAHDLAQEGVTAGVVILARRIADGGNATVSFQRQAGNHLLAPPHRHTLEVRGDYGEIDIAPVMGVAVHVGTIEDNRIYQHAFLKPSNEITDGSA